MQKVFYVDRNGNSQGPYEPKELRTLAKAGLITSDTLLFREGETGRFEAGKVRGLFADAGPASAQGDFSNVEKVLANRADHQENLASVSSAAIDIGAHSLDKVKGQASQLITDLKNVDFKEEVFPVDRTLIDQLLRDTVFWVVTALAAVPLLISTIDRREYQLTAFALFFAVLWGVVFKSLIVRAEVGWNILAASLFFTGIVGIPALLFSYASVLPRSFTAMASSDSGVKSLLGYVFQVGVCEELTKLLPVLMYLFWKRRQASPLNAILIGIFSGLGFAAFENMSYGESAIFRSAVLAERAGVRGAAVGTQMAMVNVLLRSLSLVFCHAVWSGIFAYFVTAGFASGKRFLAMTLIGLSVSAILHGAYDWLTGVQMTAATCVVVMSFVLFYAYLMKLKHLNHTAPPQG